MMINRLGILTLLLGFFAFSLGVVNLALHFSKKPTEPESLPKEGSDSLLLTPSLERQVVLSPGNHFAASIAKAVVDANADKIDEILFQPGEYEMPGGLVFEKKFGQGGLRISGAGVGLTRLVFKDVPTAILVRLDTDIRPSDVSPAFAIEGLSLQAQGNCGTALQLERRDQTRQGGIAEKRFSDMAIEGKGGNWEMGIKVIDVTFCTFRDITLRPQNPKATGIFITGQHAPVDHHLTGVRILDCQTGIKVGGNVEGVYVQQTTIIGIEIGIDWDTDSFEPLLAVTGSHISARSVCIRANNLLQPLIIGNLLYQGGSAEPWCGIQIRSKRATGYDLLQISNNILHGDPTHKAQNTGIEVNAASAGVLDANIFSAVDTGIRLGKDASGITPTDNVFRTTSKELMRENSP
jgi:hypothetical protein